ncbi:nucleoside hydrolase [Candidatus Enterococcus murrayae]|uniref:Nucleoside hydrolase n=1 Tax=Candidatus Enterococcus murrayae TaxID=2815321 RepID=A0ABS3HJU7_9ENTE|nr:nucleoside hydrolase [Enterococcus sp. MJM16]MBO0453165.1 nucleoside hydrolase [Enterococcus sp. MJM16]
MKKMILDIDTGVDDAMALAYAAGAKEVELIGVVGTYGNVYTKQGVTNVLNLLEMLGRTDVPVYLGEEHAMKKDYFDRLEISAKIHGQNGVGEIPLKTAQREVESIGGVDFIIDAIKKYGSELTIVATGPMTNLGMALQKYPEMSNKIGQVVIMGGALTVPGNVSPFTEANISQDPEAAKLLFESGTPIVMVGLDVTMRSVLQYSDTNRWRETGSPAGRNYADIVDYYIHIHEEIAPFLNGCCLHDPSAVAAAIHPEYFTTLPLYMTVETDGPSVGRTIGRTEKLREKNPNVSVCIGVDSEKVVADLCETLETLFKK